MMTDDLKTLTPTTHDIECGGKTLHLNELRFGQFAQALRYAAPFAELLAGGEDGEADFGALLARGGESLPKLMALLAGESEDWIATLAMDDALALIKALWAVNQDFFLQRLPAMLGEFGLDVQLAVPTTGASSEKRTAPRPQATVGSRS